MTLHQFFIQRSQIKKDMSVRLGDMDAHHIRVVLRLKKKAKIRLIDDEHVIHSAKLEEVGKDGVYARILESSKKPRPRNRLTVIQGIPRLTKADLIVEKLTEVGVAGIIFVPMKYTPYSDALQRISKRLERLHNVAEAAAKQCKRLDIPNVVVADDLEMSHGNLKSGTQLLVADESVSGRSLRECLSNVKRDRRLAVVIGPEGGLSSMERRFLNDKGGAFFSLGVNILRTETAAIIAAALILYELGEL
jgi:16S rRNA (uracil1498-N3)-methyltransferase